MVNKYTVIVDAGRLFDFVDWLPKLEQHECYYVALFARKKYHPSAKNDKTNLKRFTATDKNWLEHKLRQLEVPQGCYRNKDGSPIHPDALAVYICVNPRSLELAHRNTLIKLAETMGANSSLNPSTVALSEIQKAKSRSWRVDFDFDGIQFAEHRALQNESIINRDAYEVIITRGGFHLLVDPERVHDSFRKTWYKNLAGQIHCDVKGDVMIPIPGCIQGDFSPYFLD